MNDKISWVDDLDYRLSYRQDMEAQEIANEIKGIVQENGINAFIEIFAKYVVFNKCENFTIKRNN